MPKQKTHSSSKKRYKISGTGKVVRFQAYKKHKAACKSGKTRRNLRGSVLVSDSEQSRVRQLIPYK